MVKTYKTNLLNWLKTKFYTKEETNTALGDKSDIGHSHDDLYSVLGHNHNDAYYTESEVDTKLGGKANTSHSHDDRYYTESEVNNLLKDKAGTGTATTTSNGLMSAGDKKKLENVDEGATKITVDTTLNGNSTNPVRNAAVTSALAGKSDASHIHDGRYYTESEVDGKLNMKANSLHKHNDLGGLNSVSTKAGGTVTYLIKNGWCLVRFENLGTGTGDIWYTCGSLPANQVGANVYAGTFNTGATKCRVRVTSDGSLQMYVVTSLGGSDVVTGSLMYPVLQE